MTRTRNIGASLTLALVLVACWAILALAEEAKERGTDQKETAVTQAPSRPYYKDKEKGWFWYLEEKRKEEAKKAKEETRPQAKKGLQDMTTDELRAYSEEKLKAALDRPSVENVHEYMVVQKFILEKAENFTTTWQQVLRLYPDLDWTVEHPVSAVGGDVYKRLREEQITGVINELARYGGLFFFYESTCPYCQEQAAILKTFQDLHGMNVMAISLDGGGLPEFPDYKKNNGIAQNLGVARVPAIILALPPAGLAPVSTGIVTLGELRERIYNLVSDPKFFQKATIAKSY